MLAASAAVRPSSDLSPGRRRIGARDGPVSSIVQRRAGIFARWVNSLLDRPTRKLFLVDVEKRTDNKTSRCFASATPVVIQSPAKMATSRDSSRRVAQSRVEAIDYFDRSIIPCPSGEPRESGPPKT